MRREFNRGNIRLVMGIGNPEDRYRNTYHNTGALFVRFLVDELRASSKRSPHRSFSLFSAEPFSIALSLAPMNTSGESVSRALRFLRLHALELLLVHDESDLALGLYRFSFGRGAAGHHGVQSVIHALHTRDFWRLRIGIRDTSHTRLRAENYVLSTLSSAHKRLLQNTFPDILKVLLKDETLPGQNETRS